jgi:hypothetical protein
MEWPLRAVARLPKVVVFAADGDRDIHLNVFASQSGQPLYCLLKLAFVDVKLNKCLGKLVREGGHNRVLDTPHIMAAVTWLIFYVCRYWVLFIQQTQ